MNIFQKMPKSLSPNVPILSPKISILSGHHVYTPITTVTKGLGVPNFAGQLLISIQTDSKWFWAVSGIFWKMFIFVHFVHSGHQGPSGRPILVKSASYHSYLSYRTDLRPQDTCLGAQITVPKCPNFVSKNLDTLWSSCIHPNNYSYKRARRSKLCRATSNINTNRFQVVSGHFGHFQGNVHFRSFCSFR